MNTTAFWNQYSACYDVLEKTQAYTNYLETVIDCMESIQRKRILDAGSGTGNLSIRLRAQGATVIGIDSSEVAHTIHRFKDPSVRLVKRSLEEKLPFSNAEFDHVACLSVLFALSSEGRRRALDEFRRVLKPGGRLIISVASKDRKLSKILWCHIKHQVSDSGIGRGSIHLMRQAPHILRILWMNRKLTKLPRGQGYHRFHDIEMKELLNKSGFKLQNKLQVFDNQFRLFICQ